MPIIARRVFRLGLTIALSLAVAYGLQLPLPFLAPLFATMIAAAPTPPMRPKALAGLILVICITTGVGLLLIPMLRYYPVTGLLVVAVGLYFSNYLTVNKGKALVGAFLTVGIAMISAAGTLSYALATVVITALVAGISVAIVCQWLVYPWFPEDEVAAPPAKPADQDAAQSNWIALRATMIVLPAYFMVLINPAMYMPVIMKSVSLGQQASLLNARHAGRELLGSTFLGGCLAIVFWFLLGLLTSLWMFSLLMLAFGVYYASKLYGVLPSRYPASFWQNAVVTMLILLGPAVEDSANGKDVYAAFAVRMALFVVVTLYAWAALYLLEHWRGRKLAGGHLETRDMELR